MDKQNLFALYADDDITKWEKLINRKVIHKSFGFGIVTNVYRNNRTIIIECEFNPQEPYAEIKKFGPVSFTGDFFTNIEIPEELNIVLEEMHNNWLADEIKRKKQAEENQRNLEIKRQRVEKAKRQIFEEKQKKELQPNQNYELYKLIKTAHKNFVNQDDVALITAGSQLASLLSKCVEVRYDIKKLCTQVVSAHLTLGDVSEALEWIDMIHAKVKSVEPIRAKLLELKKSQGELSIEEINDVYLLNRLASMHKSLYSYQKSISIYKRSLEISADNRHFAYNGIGGIYKELFQYDKAIKYYTKGYKFEANIASLTGIGAVYRAQGKAEEAIAYYEKALEQNDLDSYANNGIGAVYFDLGMYERGSEYFMAAAEAEDLLRLFYEYKAKNQLEAALECLKLILRKAPENKKAASLLKEHSQISLFF